MTFVESMKQRLENLERYVQTLEGRLERQVDPRSFLQQPVRLAKTVTLGSYPSDPANIYPIVFLNGTFTETAGSGSASYTSRSAAAKRVGYALSSDYIPENTIVTVFEQNGRYWITPSSAVPSGGGGGTDRIVYSIDWSGTTPNINGMGPTDASTVIAWDNSTFRGTDASMTFDGTDESIEYDEGEYLITVQATFDSEAAVDSGGDLYQSPHILEGQWVYNAGRLYLQYLDGTWQTLSHSAYAFPGPENLHQTATLIYRLTVGTGETTEVRAMVQNHSQDTDDADIRVFDAHWHSDKIA